MEYVEEPVDLHEAATAEKLLDALAERMGAQRFGFWFGPETGLRFEETKVLLAVKNDYTLQWVRKNLIHDIQQACLEQFGRERIVEIVVSKKEDAGFLRPLAPVTAVIEAAVPMKVGVVSGPHFLPGPPAPPEARHEGTPPVVRPSIPRPFSPLQNAVQATGTVTKTEKAVGRRFASLETFVVDFSNRYAWGAAECVVRRQEQINPIYIFGPTSVGKTHLLEGIWTAVRRQRDRRPPLYLTGEQFLSAFMESIQPGTSRDGIQRFRNRFKGISTLLIDDIQYLARAGATQVELLHLIDTLCRQDVQIVLTGDRPIKELKGLRSEIQCRLEAGLVCPIRQPERESALKIMQNMVAQRNLPIEESVCRMVVSRLGAHVRQLSGALNRLHAVHLGTGNPITLELAEETLSDLIRYNRRDVRLPDIEKLVCETFGLSEDALQSKSRARDVSNPRMLAMWLARKYTRSALSEIGRYFGGRSHSSVISAQKKVDAWIDAEHPIHAESIELPITEAIRKIEHLLQSG